MKILRVISSVNASSGGPIEGLRLSAQALKVAGHLTEVVSLDDREADHVADFPFPVSAMGPSSMKRFNPRLVPWIQKNASRFDAAVVHGLWNFASIGGGYGLRKAGLPYVLFCHGMLDPWFRTRYPAKHLAKQAVWLAAQGKVLRDAGAVLFTSAEEQERAKGQFWGYDYEGQTVSYGVATPPEYTPEQDFAFRRLVPLLGDRPFLLFLSRIHEKKGIDLLVNAFSAVADSRPDLDLVIAGPDQVGLKGALQDIARKNGVVSRIHWPGMLSGDAKWGGFYAADAFILPSHQENFGIVVAEALACGTPVLTTDKVNIWREVEACGGGFIDTDDLAGVQRLLEKWLEASQEKKEQMSKSARAGYSSRFTIDAAASDLLASLQTSITRAMK